MIGNHKNNRYFYTVGLFLSISILGLVHYNLAAPERGLFLVLTGQLLFMLVYTQFSTKYFLQLFLLTLALGTGFYGYYRPYADLPLSNALYSTIRLFAFDVDGVFNSTGSKLVVYPLSIEIARWSAAAYMILTIINVILRLFNQSFKLMVIRLFGNHYIIFGWNERSKILVNNLRDNGRKIIVLGDRFEASDLEALRERGVIVFPGFKGEHTFYKKAAAKKAKYILLFHTDDAENLNESLSLKEYFKNIKSQINDYPKVIMHLAHRQSYTLFESLEKDFMKKKDLYPFELRIINTHKLLINKLLKEKPLYEGYEKRIKNHDEHPLHLLITGFGLTGIEIAAAAIERAHFFNKNNLKITVIDKAAPQAEKRWLRNYPNSEKAVKIDFHQADISEENLESIIQAYLPSVTHIFVCLHDDYTDMTEGVELARKISNIPIFIKMSQDGLVSKWIHENTDSFQNLYRFGYLQDILNEEYVIDEELDSLARMAHEKYRDEPDNDALPWEKLSNFEKESNRSQMNHSMTKLKLLNLTAKPKEKIDQDHPLIITEEDFKEIASEELLEKVAMTEHSRWNAFHFMRGWDVLENITPDQHKDPDQKLHGCLVPWDELDRVSTIRGIDFKYYDKKPVQSLYELWDKIGYYILKDEKSE